jgi:hypothetical protein
MPNPDPIPARRPVTPDTCPVERCRLAVAAEFSAAATRLHEDTAQVLGVVLVELAALQEVLPAPELQQELEELRQMVRVELGRVLELVQVLSNASAAAA